jgi:hypothetical protein
LPVFTCLWGGAVYYLSLEYFSLLSEKELILTYFWLAFITFSYSIFIWVLSTLLLGFDFDFISLTQKFFFLLIFLICWYVLSLNIYISFLYVLALSLGFYLINAYLVFLLIRKRISL